MPIQLKSVAYSIQRQKKHYYGTDNHCISKDSIVIVFRTRNLLIPFHSIDCGSGLIRYILCPSIITCYFFNAAKSNKPHQGVLVCL